MSDDAFEKNCASQSFILKKYEENHKYPIHDNIFGFGNELVINENKIKMVRRTNGEQYIRVQNSKRNVMLR